VLAVAPAHELEAPVVAMRRERIERQPQGGR